MPDVKNKTEEIPEKKSKMALIIGVLLALLGGGGGFYATWSGAILSSESTEPAATRDLEDQSLDIAFIPVDPLVISLGKNASSRHLRFRAELEVPSAYQEEVEKLLPRVVDVLNSYLRAIDPNDLENISGLARLRAQMLRRVQVVVGHGRVKDLLVMEFVLN